MTLCFILSLAYIELNVYASPYEKNFLIFFSQNQCYSHLLNLRCEAFPNQNGSNII